MLNRFCRTGLIAMVAIGLTATAAFAIGVPDPVLSTVDEILITCPGGDVDFSVTVLDASGAPCSGAIVEIDFCPCFEAMLCQYVGAQACSNGKYDRLVAAADVNGQVLFYPAAGGDCGGQAVDIIADGVVLAQRVVKPMDTNGDFIVEIGDFSNTNPLNDYTGDGFVDLSDYAIFSPHAAFTHTCDGPVDTEDQTWGGIKSLWR